MLNDPLRNSSEKKTNGTLLNNTLCNTASATLQKIYIFVSTIGFRIIASLEEFFYWLGYSIAVRPYHAIIGCLLLSTLFSTGLVSFEQEKRPEKLWIPQDSSFIKDSAWTRENFPNTIRPQAAIFTASNVLEKEVLLQMLDVVEEIQNITANNKTWQDMCFRLPVVKIDNQREKRDTTEDPFGDFDEEFEDDLFTNKAFGVTKYQKFDPSVHLPQTLYCSLLNSLKEHCWLNSVLELWSFDRATIEDLSQEDIYDAINSTTISPVFGTPRNFSETLGAIEYDTDGRIIKAGSTMFTWFVQSDPTIVSKDDIVNDMGTGEMVDKNTIAWEQKFIEVFRNLNMENLTIDFFSSKSFGDISGETIKNDAQKLSIGFMIMFIYVQVMLGRFNFVEHRAFLSLIGIGSIAMGCIVAYGICSAFHITYGPVHNILPFLLLGIGIDDMFVIVQCWNNLTPLEKTKSIQERIGLTLKHAGVSITITSLTDFTAFAIGATTVLPSLRSFCIYAAVGILATYTLQATFFVAWFSLDQRRIESNRDGCIVCFKHKDYTPNKLSQKDIIQSCFNFLFGKYLFKTVAKIFILMATLVLFGAGLWGVVLLRQEFDPVWFLPQNSYLYKYFMRAKQYYPGDGELSTIYLSGLDHGSDLHAVSDLVLQLKNEKDIVNYVDSWYTGFESFVNIHYEKDIPVSPLSQEEFEQYIAKYLFSPSGSKYRRHFKFKNKLECLKPAPEILISTFDFKFRKFKGSFEHVPAMNKIKDIIKNVNFTSENGIAKLWSRAFAGWETDEVIAVELYRNLSWAMGCVFITTLILIANLTTSIFVLICVTLTLIDVGGMMHFWGLTIDVVSCIDLVLAIGLCVDYAAHIGHTFMTCQGTRNERAVNAVKSIGPAVLNGGISTFLAFIVLANSYSHVFNTYFKIFFLVVVFGLFHGLLFLPVLLSLIGPDPYHMTASHSNGSLPKNAIANSEHIVTERKKSDDTQSFENTVC